MREPATAGRSLLLRVDGVLDVPAARRVAEAVAAVGQGSTVQLDLSRVREFHDLGVAALAQALEELGGRVAVTGLCQHQLRLLRYLGIDAGSGARAPAL